MLMEWLAITVLMVMTFTCGFVLGGWLFTVQNRAVRNPYQNAQQPRANEIWSEKVAKGREPTSPKVRID